VPGSGEYRQGDRKTVVVSRPSLAGADCRSREWNQQ